MHATESASARKSLISRWGSPIALIAVILAYVALINLSPREPLGTQGPAIGRSLGYLELEGLSSGAANVSLSDLAGHVTLINFWGTWCPPCIRELPEIERLHEQFQDQPAFRLYAVSCGQGADADLETLREETTRFLNARSADRPTELPIYADHNAATRQAMSLVLGAQLAYPTTLVLDREGRIRGFWQGYHPRAASEMEQLVEKLLSEVD